MRSLLTFLAVAPLLACTDVPTAPIDSAVVAPAMSATTPATSKIQLLVDGSAAAIAETIAQGVEKVDLAFNGAHARFRAAGMEITTPPAVTGMTIGLVDGRLAALYWKVGMIMLPTNEAPQSTVGAVEVEVEVDKFRDVDIHDINGTQTFAKDLLRRARIVRVIKAF